MVSAPAKKAAHPLPQVLLRSFNPEAPEQLQEATIVFHNASSRTVAVLWITWKGDEARGGRCAVFCSAAGRPRTTHMLAAACLPRPVALVPCRADAVPQRAEAWHEQPLPHLCR